MTVVRRHRIWRPEGIPLNATAGTDGVSRVEDAARPAGGGGSDPDHDLHAILGMTDWCERESYMFTRSAW